MGFGLAPRHIRVLALRFRLRRLGCSPYPTQQEHTNNETNHHNATAPLGPRLASWKRNPTPHGPKKITATRTAAHMPRNAENEKSLKTERLLLCICIV